MSSQTQPSLRFRAGQEVIAHAAKNDKTIERGVFVFLNENQYCGNVAFIWLAAARFVVDEKKLAMGYATDGRTFAWLQGAVVAPQTLPEDAEPVEVLFDHKNPSEAFKCADTGRIVESAQYVHFHRSHGDNFIYAYDVKFRP